MNINPPVEIDTDNDFSAEAAKIGLSLPDYIWRLIHENTDKPKNGSELISYWQREGVIGSHSDIPDSQAHAREIRDRAEHRNRLAETIELKT